MELSPGPGAMELESDEQGHYPNMGDHHKAAPQAQAGRLGHLGRQSIFTCDDNKLLFLFFLMKILFSTPVNLGREVWNHTVSETCVAIFRTHGSENCGWTVTVPPQPLLRKLA